MDVYSHLSSRVDGEVDEIRRLRIGGDKLLVARQYGLVEERMTHEAAVDKEKLLIAALLGRPGQADKAFYFHQRGLCRDMRERTLHVLAKEVRHALLQAAARRN